MRVILLILVFMVPWLGVADLAAAAPKVAADGQTLVLEGGNSSRKSDKPGDTLYELLGQEVQVFIFNSKTRVWPQVYVRPTPSSWKTASWKTSRYNPQVEALISKYANLYGVDPSLVRAVVRHESGFNAGAVSPKGAQGLMQLMPGTAALMGVRDPFDPEQNIAGGVGYLRRCLDRFQHNVPLAVAAYNAGPERVAQCGAIPPFQETQAFVSNVMGTYGGPPSMTAAPAGGPAPARKAAKQLTTPKTEKIQDAPRRPKAKIIEVRFRKAKTRQTEEE